MLNLSDYKRFMGDQQYKIWSSHAANQQHSEDRNLDVECAPLTVEPKNKGLTFAQAEELISITANITE